MQLINYIIRTFRQYTLCLIFACILINSYSYAQFPHVVSYDFDYDMKAYSNEISTDAFGTPGQPEATITAGTVYDYGGTAGNNVIHCLSLTQNGSVNASEILDDPNYVDERVVDIVGDKNTSAATYFITALARPNAANDRVLITPVDNDCIVQADPVAIYPSNSNESLYPLHSILHSNGDIYICGYWTDNNTDLPNTPGFSTYGNKKGFVIRVDYTGGAFSVLNTALINTSYTTSTGATCDFDIAMRLTEMSNGDIHVTGSVNGVSLDAITSTDVFKSATMNIVFDQNLTITPNPVADDHFCMGVGDAGVADEYGIAMYEDPTFGTAYVVGNYFHSRSIITGSTTVPFDVEPRYMWVTGLDNTANSMTPVYNAAGRSLVSAYDYFWGLQTLYSHDAPNVEDTRFLIAGMQVNEWCGSLFSYDNVRPFLFDMENSFNTGTGVITSRFNDWISYRNQTGTGNKSVTPAAPNNYIDLGGGLSNIAWNPTFAARPDPQGSNHFDVLLVAPKWQAASGSLPDRLNLKQVRGDLSNFYRDVSCVGSDARTTGPLPCSLSAVFYSENIKGIDHALNPITKTYATFNYGTTNTTTTSQTTYAQNNTDFCSVSGNYKSTGIKGFTSDKIGDVYVYPNPASEYIQLKVKNGVSNETHVKIEIINLQGQLLSKIYDGKGSGINNDNKLSMPALAHGVYFVKIYLDGRLYTQKLTLK